VSLSLFASGEVAKNAPVPGHALSQWLFVKKRSLDETRVDAAFDEFGVLKNLLVERCGCRNPLDSQFVESS
jgi:hypothetical protein